MSVHSKTALLSALALASIAGVASAVPVTTWSFGSSHLQHLRDDDGTFWVDYDPLNPSLVPDVMSTPLDNGIKLSGPGSKGFVFGFTGDNYIPTPSEPTASGNLRGNRLVINGTATINGAAWQNPFDIVRTSFEFDFAHTGGDVELYTIETSFTLLDASNNFLGGVGSATGFSQTFDPGFHAFDIDFDDRFGPIDQPNDISAAVAIEWQIAFYFDWTNYAQGDQFYFDIPQNSVDIQAQTIPTPGAAALLSLAGLAGLRRRR
ncbi:MAG: MYXO-CTERM sorting domain-containing protein [Phycisphaerales bacterium]